MKRNKNELKLIPVLKTRGKNRKIPVYQSPKVVAALQKEEEMLAKFREGTTPQGAEILRKLLHFIEKSCWENKPLEAILKYVQNEIVIFAIFRKEWLLLLSRCWRQPALLKLENSRPESLAMIIVALKRVVWAVKIKNRRGGLPFDDKYDEEQYQSWMKLVNGATP